MTAQLTGSELLAKVKELGDIGKSDIVRVCGYVSEKKDGGERLNFTAFYEALLEAKGLRLNSGSKSSAPRGKQISYRTTVHFNGNLLIGKAYVLAHGFQPGDEFAIKPTKNGFRLVALNQTEDELADDDQDISF